MRDDNSLCASQGYGSLAEFARMIDQAERRNANELTNRLDQEAALHGYQESPPIAPGDQLLDCSSAADEACGRDNHDDEISVRAEDQGVTKVADGQYATQSLRTPRERLVLVIAICGLIVAGSAIAFGYRATFGGLTSPTLQPSNQKSKGSKEIVRISSDLRANHGGEASQARATATDATESPLPPEGSLPGTVAPSTVGQIRPNKEMVDGLEREPDSSSQAATPVASAAATTTTLTPLSLETKAANDGQMMPLAPGATSVPASYNLGGEYTVQVTAERSERKARAEFWALQAKHRQQFSGRHPIIRRAELGPKGTYYRALVGPFASAQEAGRWCGELRAVGGNCRVQRN